MVVQTFNSSTQEEKVGRFLGIEGQVGLHREFQVSQDYIEKLCLKNKKKNKQNQFKHEHKTGR